MFAYWIGEHQQGSAISDLYESRHGRIFQGWKQICQKQMLDFDGKRSTWTHFVIFEMAKLARCLLLTALHCIYMRKKLYDSAPENISVFIQQRNISFHNDVSPKSREIGGLVVRLWQKLKNREIHSRSLQSRELGPLGESKSNCWSLHHVY